MYILISLMIRDCRDYRARVHNDSFLCNRGLFQVKPINYSRGYALPALLIYFSLPTFCTIRALLHNSWMLSWLYWSGSVMAARINYLRLPSHLLIDRLLPWSCLLRSIRRATLKCSWWYRLLVALLSFSSFSLHFSHSHNSTSAATTIQSNAPQQEGCKMGTWLSLHLACPCRPVHHHHASQLRDN